MMDYVQLPAHPVRTGEARRGFHLIVLHLIYIDRKGVILRSKSIAGV